MLESLDFGSTYMLGSAKFRLQGISDPRSIDSKKVKATFVCVESGKIPGTPYKEQDPINPQNTDLKSIEERFNEKEKARSH